MFLQHSIFVNWSQCDISTSVHCTLLGSRGMHRYASLYSGKCVSKTYKEEVKLFNTVIIFVFFCFVFLFMSTTTHGMHSSAWKQGTVHPSSTSEHQFLRQQHHTCVVLSWARIKDWQEKKKLLNKIVIFVFFAHKIDSRSFITLMLNHWWHMDYFTNVLTTFLGLEHGCCGAIYAGSESSRIS